MENNRQALLAAKPCKGHPRNVDFVCGRALAVKPRAFGAPLRGFGA